jgi:predicted RNA-binding protein with PUA-like domain
MHPELEDLPLIRRGNRLSVMPLSKQHWDFILSLE